MRPFSRGPCRLSIHRQILAIALAPALIVTGLLLFVVYQGNLQHNRRLLDQHGQVLAAQLAGALEYSLATGALEQLPAIIDATVQPATAILGTPVRGVIVTDATGRVLYRRPAADPAPPAPEALADLAVIPPEEDRVRFAAPVLLRPLALSAVPSPPRPLGEVAVELSVAIAQARWHRGLAWDLGLVLLTFAGAAGLAHWTGRRLSGAIRRIATAIECIKRGDFAVRVRPTDRNELGTLQDGVNLLAETLARGKARLDLELAKVRAEYQQALDDLQVQTRAAERANAAKSLFLAKVSHEMRTPLYWGLGSSGTQNPVKHPHRWGCATAATCLE
jgi:two-component system sensor histidine kinase BarA